MATLLELVQGFCEVTGLDVPTAVAQTEDDQVRQIRGLLNEGVADLGQKYDWTQLQFVAGFVSTAEESQGALETIAPGYRRMLGNTLWSTTRSIPGRGGISPQDSQILRVWGRPSALTSFREMNGELHFIPAGPAGQKFSFEYQSRFCVRDGKTKMPKEFFTADDDYTILPASLYRADLRWRWKAEKGLAYSELFRTFEQQAKQAHSDSKGAMPLRMDSCNRDPGPGIIVPLGNWQRP